MKMPHEPLAPALRRPAESVRLAAFVELTKPRVVVLIVFTAVVGMLLAQPGSLTVGRLLLSAAGIWLAAGSAAAFNHVLERRADALMARTRARPLPTDQLSPAQAVGFAFALCALSAVILAAGVNVLTAILTLGALVGYSVIYTVVLKPRTPQNIVLGGAAGAMPPVLGWTAVTGSASVDAWLLFLIIFVWTPPHFWSLALYRQREYAAAGIPMLPVTHGSEFTRRSILAYTVVLVLITTLPYLSGMSGLPYLLGAAALGLRFVAYAWRLHARYSDALARRVFRYSINYLAALFALLLLDRYIPVAWAAARSFSAALPT